MTTGSCNFLNRHSSAIVTIAISAVGQSLIELRERVPALGNVAPLSLLDTPAGYQLVIDTLGQIKYGVFA